MSKQRNSKSFYNTAIPEDWEVKKFQDFAKFYSGGTPLTSKTEYYKGDISFIKSGEIYFDKTEQYISEEGLKKSSAKMVYRGDLLYALYGANSGEVAISKINGAINQAILCIKLNEDYDTVFIYNFLVLKKDSIIKKYLQGGQGNLSAEIIKSISIHLPPLPEQKAIARILSLMDTAISKNNSLITKKELQKKWLMQNLLTGRKRLKGYEKERWSTMKLSDIFQFINSYPVSRDGLSSCNGKHLTYCIHYGDIHAVYENEFLDFSRQTNIPQLKKLSIKIPGTDLLKNGDIVMADASEDYKGVGEIVEIMNLNGKSAVGGLHTIVLRADENIIVPKFRAYLFDSEGFRNSLRRIATGTSVYSVTKSQISKVNLTFPKSLNEQKQLSVVLQKADKEIELLKLKLEKFKQKKKWLMQVLLTGKVRVNSK